MVTPGALRSPLGALKFILIGLLVSIVGLSYFGNEGGRLYFGLQDYLGVGVTVGFCLIIPFLLVSYAFNGSIFILESLVSITGAGAFCGVGLVTYNSYSHPELGSPAGKTLAGLCFSTAGVLLLNLLLVCYTMRK